MSEKKILTLEQRIQKELAQAKAKLRTISKIKEIMSELDENFEMIPDNLSNEQLLELLEDLAARKMNKKERMIINELTY